MTEFLTRQQRGLIADRVSAWFVRQAGKGPANISVRADQSTVTVRMDGLLTPLEKLVADHGRASEVVQLRKRLFEIGVEALVSGLKTLFDLHANEISVWFDGHSGEQEITVHVTREPIAGPVDVIWVVPVDDGVFS